MSTDTWVAGEIDVSVSETEGGIAGSDPESQGSCNRTVEGSARLEGFAVMGAAGDEEGREGVGEIRRRFESFLAWVLRSNSTGEDDCINLRGLDARFLAWRTIAT